MRSPLELPRQGKVADEENLPRSTREETRVHDACLRAGFFFQFGPHRPPELRKAHLSGTGRLTGQKFWGGA